MHFGDEVMGAWLPGLHANGATTPVPQALPAGHAVHSSALRRLVALEKLPATHGKATAAPCGQKCPGKQALQAVACGAAWNVPDMHSAHVSLPPVLYDPTVHTTAIVAPCTHAEPAGHTKHSF